MVMSIVSVDDVVDAGFAADPPPIGEAVRPLKISHSTSTPTKNAAATSFCRNLTDIQDHNDLLQVMRLHLKTAWTRQREGPGGWFVRLHLQLITSAARVCVYFIIHVAGHLQDHLLTN